MAKIPGKGIVKYIILLIIIVVIVWALLLLIRYMWKKKLFDLNKELVAQGKGAWGDDELQAYIESERGFTGGWMIHKVAKDVWLLKDMIPEWKKKF